MKYFLHDSNAFNDEKITRLYIQFGYEGLGLFYTCLEKFAQQEKPINTLVLKHQLNIGKRLEKCWLFMEQIGLLSSNNGETFNKQLLNFSESYKIKKEKNAKRISQWREKQKDIKNVTCYESVSNASKVKVSKVKESKEEKEIIKEKNWKTDFEIYKKELQTEFEKLISDTSYIFERENYHPGLDIIKSLEKAFNDFWNTEAGWKNKKQSRIKEIDWRATFNNALSLKFNQVWKKNEQKKSSAGSRAMETMMKYKALADQEEKQNLLKNE